METIRQFFLRKILYKNIGDIIFKEIYLWQTPAVGQKPATPVCYPAKQYNFDANGNVHPPKQGEVPICKPETKQPTQHKNEKHADNGSCT